MKKRGDIPAFRWRVILIGVGGTIILFVSLSAILYSYYFDEFLVRSLSPNEIGDTIAGFSGALAFLWLVLGYFQQGEELRETRKEISLQRESLDLQHKEMIEQASALKKSAKESERQVNVLLANQKALVLSSFLSTIPDRMKNFNGVAYRLTEELGFDVSLENAIDFLIEKNAAEDVRNIHKLVRDAWLTGNQDAISRCTRRLESAWLQIDIYVAEFEQLIDDARKFDIDGLCERSISKTPQGKVYELLCRIQGKREEWLTTYSPERG